MKAIKLYENQKLQIKEVVLPKLKSGEVLIKVEYCGICGSDLTRYYKQAKYYPIVLGHEISGVVEAVFSAKDQHLVGKKVTISPLQPCFKCNECLAGNYYACKEYIFMGSGCDGGFQTHVIVNAPNVVVLPDELDLQSAAFIEPLTIAIHAVDCLTINCLDQVLVIGCGTIGLMIIQTLKARGILNVIAADIDQSKLVMAQRLGADTIINTNKDSLVQVDIAFECTGVSAVQSQIIENIKPKGRVCYVGTAHGDVVLANEKFEKILRQEMLITGSWMSYSTPFPGNEWNYAIALLNTKQVTVKPLIHVIEMEQLSAGFEMMKNGQAYKVIVRMDE